MGIVWGIVLIVLSLLGWGGQAISWIAPAAAARWSLTESEESVEPVYHADVRGEALWDTLSLWTLLVAGLLLIFDSPGWAYFGLIGGGMYLYFAGRGILTRLEMQRRGFRIGEPRNVGAAYWMLAIWGVVAVITIVAAIAALPTE